MADDTATWKLIHAERKALADTLEALGPDDWSVPSLCAGWTVQVAAAHVVAGAEQTGPNFFKAMTGSAFRFNTMIDRAARRLGTVAPAGIVERLRARTATTNHPPAPVMAMLGEVIVHGEDIRRPLGLPGAAAGAATDACLEMYTRANFPVGGKRRISGLRLVATDTGWSHGDGPEVSGPGLSLVLAMTGRGVGLAGLTGDGVPALQARLSDATV